MNNRYSHPRHQLQHQHHKSNFPNEQQIRNPYQQPNQAPEFGLSQKQLNQGTHFQPRHRLPLCHQRPPAPPGFPQFNNFSRLPPNGNVYPPYPPQTFPLPNLPPQMNIQRMPPPDFLSPNNVRFPNFSHPPPNFMDCFSPNQMQSPPLMNHPFQPNSFNLTSCNPTPVETDVKEEYREVMQDLVTKWLCNKNIFVDEKRKIPSLMKLKEYHKAMKLYVQTIEKLRDTNDLLAENMEVCEKEWKLLMEKVATIKNDVLVMQARLFSKEQVNAITSLINARKKKRDRIRRKRNRDKADYVVSLSNRIKLNEQIDEWQQKEQTKIMMEKMEETLRNEAGESLTEVKRKQTEANELIEIAKHLQQIRNVRKETAIYKGILVTEKDDDAFNSKIDDVINLLTTQRKVYEAEERALRVLREEEAEEIKRVEDEKRQKLKQNRQRDLTQVDPLYSYRVYWQQGEESIAGLIHIRRLWDMYLYNPEIRGSSRLPKGWVQPSVSCSEEWKKYQVKKKEKSKT